MMELFRHKVFRMLLDEEKITETQVEKLLAWRHTGFSVYRGEKVEPEDKPGREHMASYILHPPMSQEKMTYDPATGTVQYRTQKKKGPEVTETFSALDWLARLSAHIHNEARPMVFAPLAPEPYRSQSASTPPLPPAAARFSTTTRSG